VQALLGERHIEPRSRTAELKGISEAVTVYEIPVSAP
jgi:hypothetical protein